MRVVWTQRAVLNLHHIREYIGLDNPAAAERVGARLAAATESLSRFPESGRSGEVAGTRELIVPGLPYFIVYRVQSDRVAILRVLHVKQKWPPTS